MSHLPWSAIRPLLVVGGFALGLSIATHAQTACSYTLSTTTALVSLSGGTGSVTVMPSASSCTWTAESSAGFITLTSGTRGSGTGAVGYSIGRLAGGWRTGAISIAGRTVIVTQSATLVPTITTFDFPGAVSTKAFGINDAGQVVGTYSDGRVEHGFLLSAGTFATVDYPGAVFTTRAMGINSAGQIVGCYYDFDAPGACYKGFLKSGGTFTPIAYPGSFSTNPNGISDSGQIVGSYAFSGAAFTLQGGRFTRIQVPGAADGQTYGLGLNNDSAVVGWYNGGITSGFVLKQGTFSTIVFPGAAITKARGINAAEQIVGDFFVYGSPNRAGGFFSSGGTFGTLELPGLTEINGINNANQIVGSYGSTGSEHGFIATLTMTDSRPTVSLDRTALVFAGVTGDTVFRPTTSAQIVRLKQTGAGTVTWTAASNRPWLRVTPASGFGPGALSISVEVAAGLPAPDNLTGAITIALAGAANAPGPINIAFSIVPGSAPVSQPFGSFDTPAGDATVLAGSIAVTGWTLDNIGVKRVELWRDLQPGETTPPFTSTPTDPRKGKVFIGSPTFVDGARPDVEGLHRAMPFSYRAGWGYLLLTRGLWNQGNGSFNLYAYAFDQEDNFATIGKKTIVVNNAGANRPFGSIDAPAIGGDASGPNFGWALTPAVNGLPTCKIPASGVQASIDSGPLQPVVYGDPRSDIAAFFPGFSNSSAAGGHVVFDWSTLTNGVHTIGWLVTDDCNRADGVGSRFFNVTTGTSLTAAETPFAVTAASLLATGRRDTESDAPITVARGYGELPEIVAPGTAGSRTVEITQTERIEIRLPRGFESADQLGPNGKRRALPVGSTWDEASRTFYWQPVPGYLGRYRLVFSNGQERISVRVFVTP